MRRRRDLVGEVFTTNAGDRFTVTEYLYSKGTEYYYNILFHETGKTKIAEKRNILRGNVRDNYRKSIYGVACKGDASSKSPKLNKIAFKRWYAMIERCYNPDAINFRSYGAKGVTVSDRWLCFENFLCDLPSIPGFDENAYICGDIQLDKDTLIEGNKTYEIGSCRFLPRIANISARATARKKFYAISPNGEQYTFFSQSECAETFGLTARTIGKVLDGHLKTHKGWTFKYAAEEVRS